MAMTKEQLLKEAMALDPEERDALAEELLCSLPRAAQAEIDAAWAAEIERRIDALDSGNVTTIRGDEVMEDARRAIERERTEA